LLNFNVILQKKATEPIGNETVKTTKLDATKDLQTVKRGISNKVAGIIKGTVKDSASGDALSNATISIISAKDSADILYTTTTSYGFFQIKDVNTGSYIIMITYQGLETIKKPVSISDEENIVDLGALQMEKAYKILDEVTVKVEVPISVSGDTVAYRADAFVTKPNATVEDLLKKLPGLQVDRDGTIKAQGEQIQKVYVDGKEFFSNDPKLATKNLTADMIEKVQVYNDMSDQAKFNGIDDGSRSKAINLKLKKNKKRGVFGTIYAGYGTNERYDAGISTNLFKNNSQFSIIGKANNINNISYNSSGVSGLGNGLYTNSFLGLNYRNTGSKKIEINGSYHFTETNSNIAVKNFRQTFSTDSTLLTNKETVSNNNSKTQRFNFNLVWNIDSLNSVIFNPNINVSDISRVASDTSGNYIEKAGAKYVANNSKTLNKTDGLTANINNSLIWRKRFIKRGRTLSLNIFNAMNNNNVDGFTLIDTRFYNSIGRLQSQRNTDYKISSNNEINNYGASLSYTEPLGKRTVLEFNYNYYNNKNDADRRTYNYNSITKTYDQLVDTLTNKFQNTNETNKVGTNFRYVFNRNSFQLGVAVQQVSVDNYNYSRNLQQFQLYKNFFPTASFNYQLDKSKSVQLHYRGQTNQPGITQLQDLTDVTNYPYIRKGNPLLKQEFINNINLIYSGSNLNKYSSMFFNISYRTVNNRITNSIQQEAGGIQINTPVNADGSYNVNSTLSLSLPVNRSTGSNFSAYTAVNYYRDVNIINKIKNFTNNFSSGETFRFSYNFREVFDLGINASVTYNKVDYTVQKSLNNQYFTHNYTADFSWIIMKKFTLTSDVDYVGYSGGGNNLKQNYIIWNAALPIIEN
jgi:hypothetical protein